MPAKSAQRTSSPPEAQPRDIPSTNEIIAYFHCRRCLLEIPAGTSPRDWCQIETGWTPLGLQVWCRRHEINIMHVDFQGMQHPANLGGERVH